MKAHISVQSQLPTIRNLARQYIYVFGERAGLEAALNADHYYACKEIGKFEIWMAILEAVERIRAEPRMQVH